MRGLTVKQPWAGCIAHIGKNVENRTRCFPPALIGTDIAIHAGQNLAEDDAIISVPDGGTWQTLFASNAEWDAWRFWHLGRKPRDVANWPPKLALGAVVAVAAITGFHFCGPDSCGERAIEACAGVLCSRWAQVDQWHWQLADVRPLAKPVPCKGALGLWKVPDDIESAIRAQLEAVDA